MTATDLIRECTSLGIALVDRGETLRIEAPPGALTPELRQRLAERKTEILAELRTPAPRAGRPRLAAALAIENLPAGLIDDDDARPGDLEALDGQALAAYARALHATAERRAGRVPPGWDKTAQCAGCGPVWLWVASRVAGCPWCANRRDGRPIPRPTVHCRDCASYRPNVDNPEAGIGRCSTEHDRATGAPPPFPNTVRTCAGFQPAQPQESTNGLRQQHASQ